LHPHLWFIIQNSSLNTVRRGGLTLFSLLFSFLKNHLSLHLLASKSNRMISPLSFFFVVSLTLLVGLMITVIDLVF
jgi:hypothetical protein